MEGAAPQSTAVAPSSDRRNTRNSSENDVVGGRGEEQQQKQQQQQSRVAQDEENRQNGSPAGKRKLNLSSPARAKKKLHPIADSPCRKNKSNGSNNSYNNNNTYNSSNAASLQFPAPSSSTPTLPNNDNNTTTTSSNTSSSLQSNHASSASASSLSIVSGVDSTELQSQHFVVTSTTATTLQSNNASSTVAAAASNSSSNSSEVLIQVRGVLQEARFPPTDSEIEAALARNGNSALRTITELLPSSTGVASVVSSSTNGVAASHSSTNNNELRMDIDSSSADGSKANEVSVETLLSIMEDPSMNLYKYVYNGGNHRKLPKDLHKFTGNNILEGHSFVNDDKLEQRAVAEFGDKTRYIRAQTVSAGMPFLCMGMQNSFPVTGKEEEQVGPLRSGNRFLESRGISAISTGPTQSMQFRLLAIGFSDYFGVDSDTAHVTAAQTTLWLTEAAPYTLGNMAGSKGNKDHDTLLRLLKASAQEVAECNRELIQHTGIEYVIGYGNIAQDFLSDNDVLPSGVRVHESPAGCHVVQGPTFRAVCEALIAPIVMIKHMIGDNSPLDIDKVMLIAARNFIFYPKVNDAISLRGGSADFIMTASYPIDDDTEVELFRGRGTQYMKKLLRRKGIQFRAETFPTQDMFFDSNGELVQVQWKGLNWRMEYWYKHTYFGNHDFGTASGGFGAREGSLLQHYIQNHSKQDKDARTAIVLSITKTDEGDITNDNDCVIVCGLALEVLRANGSNQCYVHGFISQRLSLVFEGLMFGDGSKIFQCDVPLAVFGGRAVIKSKIFDSIEDMQTALPVNKDAFKRAVDCTDIGNWRAELFLHKPSTGNDKPVFIGSISTLAELKPQHPKYQWHDEQEARPKCTASDGAAINTQLDFLKVKKGSREASKWVDGEAALSAMKEKKSVAIECPTVPSSTNGKIDGYTRYEQNENKETFIFAAVRLDKDDSNNEDDSKSDSIDDDDDVDEDQYY